MFDVTPGRHGLPIWYELLTPDHAQAKRFYENVVGWQIGPQPAGYLDYRMIQAGDGQVGGVMALTDAMHTGGAMPGWLFHLGVDDVDAAADRINAAGGAVLMPPFDMAGAGRMALVADPQGAAFYIMKGTAEGDSTAFAPMRDGHWGWHELWTSDARGALAFYREVFGWDNRDTMDMGQMGNYHFLDCGDVRLGALAQARAADQAPRWTFYAQVVDLDVAIDHITDGGGAIVQGPHAVPGGSRIVIGTDPAGATFALMTQPEEEG